MRLFFNGIGSLILLFLKDVSWVSMLKCFVTCTCVAVTSQLAQRRRPTKLLLVYCVVLSLYTTLIIALTLLGRRPGTIAGASQHSLLVPYVNETEHVIDIVYNALLFAPFGFLLALGYKSRVSLAMVILATVAIELVQMNTGRGLFELSDIGGNTVGGVLGICIGYPTLSLVQRCLHRTI